MAILSARDFLGDWRFERTIADAKGHQTMQVTGMARWSEQGDRVLYAETGQLHIPGQAPLTAERRYYWHFAGPMVNVSFDDGRPFHAFRAEGCEEGTDHLCGEDMYRVVYDFTTWPDWSSVWAVHGPRKDYESRTRYARID